MTEAEFQAFMAANPGDKYALDLEAPAGDTFAPGCLDHQLGHTFQFDGGPARLLAAAVSQDGSTLSLIVERVRAN